MNNINMGATVGGSGHTRMAVEGFWLVQTGTYQEQQLRPFNIVADPNAINRLQVATRDGRNLGVSAVQEIASEIVTPQAQVEGSVAIAEGWNSRRFRFMLKVNEVNQFMTSTSTQRIFFGYTDNCDASLNYLEDDMRIYFNSETIIAQAIRNTVHGPQKQATILAANQIVSPVNIHAGHNGMFARPTSHLIRPEDTFNLSQLQVVASNLEKSGMIDGVIAKSYDHRSMVGEGGAFKYSLRRDTSPTRYLSDSMQAWNHAVKEQQMANENDEFNHGGVPNFENMYGDAANACRNHNIFTNTFLATLRDHAGYMEQGYVTYRDLKRLFPETARQDVTKFSMDNGRSIRKVNHAQDSQMWTGADYTSIGASLLAQTIPSIMMDTFLRTVSFAVTNGSGPNTYVFEIHPDNTKSIIDNIDMRPYIQEFERRLNTDVLNAITKGNQIPFRISMFSDLTGDSVIDIQIESAGVERFVAPTFTDSLFSPMITTDANLPGTIASTLTYLVKQVIPVHTGNAQEIYTGYQHPTVTPAVQMPMNQMPKLSTGVMNNVADLGLL